MRRREHGIRYPFVWAGYQRQTMYDDAIKNLITTRCVQEKIGEDDYKKDLVPFLKVTRNTILI